MTAKPALYLCAIFFLFCLDTNYLVFAQDDDDFTYEMDEALDQFVETEFMETFIDFRDRSEEAIAEFKANEKEYEAEDVRKVKIAYRKTAQQFNGVLDRIKKDMMNRKKMKYISKFPNLYAKELEGDMYKLSDFYDNHFRKTLSEATNNEIDGSPILELLSELLGLTDEFADFVGKLKKPSKKFTTRYLDEKLVAEYQFKNYKAIKPMRDE